MPTSDLSPSASASIAALIARIEACELIPASVVLAKAQSVVGEYLSQSATISTQPGHEVPGQSRGGCEYDLSDGDFSPGGVLSIDDEEDYPNAGAPNPVYPSSELPESSWPPGATYGQTISTFGVEFDFGSTEITMSDTGIQAAVGSGAATQFLQVMLPTFKSALAACMSTGC